MSEEKPRLGISIEGFDPLGLKATAEITKEVVKLGTDGVRDFLNLTCKPLLEELGLDGKDRYRSWKLLNTIKVLKKGKGKIEVRFRKRKNCYRSKSCFSNCRAFVDY